MDKGHDIKGLLDNSPISVFSGRPPGNYMERPPQYEDEQPPYDEDGHQEIPRQYYDDDMVVPQESHMLRAPPEDYIDDGRRTPSTQGGSKFWGD